jgi:hypothetical protein
MTEEDSILYIFICHSFAHSLLALRVVLGSGRWRDRL